jgi:hypothetical protein
MHAWQVAVRAQSQWSGREDRWQSIANVTDSGRAGGKEGKRTRQNLEAPAVAALKYEL